MFGKLFFLIGEYIHLKDVTIIIKFYFKDISIDIMKRLNQ